MAEELPGRRRIESNVMTVCFHSLRVLMLALCVPTSLAVAAELPLAGHWVINAEETDKVRVPFKKDKANILSSGRVNSSVSVGGVALPLPGSARPRPMSNLSPKDPKVLRCTRMQITPKGKKILLNYDESGKETLVKGHYRGRDTTWDKSKIQQKYKTSERRVTKSWTLRKDGRLLVSVVLNPIGERKRTYNRVFDRAPASAALEGAQPAVSDAEG